jgi:hypothetical protein
MLKFYPASTYETAQAKMQDWDTAELCETLIGYESADEAFRIANEKSKQNHQTYIVIGYDLETDTFGPVVGRI